MGLTTFLHDGYPPSKLTGLQFLAFSEIAVIQHSTISSDGGGGGTAMWSNAGTTYCRVTALGGSPRLLAGRIVETSTHVVTAPEDTVISTNDRLIVANRGTLVVTNVSDSTDARTVRAEVTKV